MHTYGGNVGAWWIHKVYIKTVTPGSGVIKVNTVENDGGSLGKSGTRYNWLVVLHKQVLVEQEL